MNWLDDLVGELIFSQCLHSMMGIFNDLGSKKVVRERSDHIATSHGAIGDLHSVHTRSYGAIACRFMPSFDLAPHP